MFSGNPEEMLIVYRAIKRSYSVVVIGPLLSGSENLCFEAAWPPEASKETAEVHPWHAHKSEPRYAFTGSSALHAHERLGAQCVTPVTCLCFAFGCMSSPCVVI